MPVPKTKKKGHLCREKWETFEITANNRAQCVHNVFFYVFRLFRTADLCLQFEILCSNIFMQAVSVYSQSSADKYDVAYLCP